jgi:hypothetical protein
MDARLSTSDANKIVKESLNSKNLNLELANNIENIQEIKELIKIGAAATYKQEYEKRRIKFGVPCEIDEFPKHIYLYTALVWWILFTKFSVSKYTFFLSIFAVKLIWNLRRLRSCVKQEEYQDFIKLQKSLYKVVEMKKKSLTTDEILKALGYKRH